MESVKAQNIKMIIFDIDGVITDGKCYLGKNGYEMKTYSLKDMDAINWFHECGYKTGCITGENNEFCQAFIKKAGVDYFKTGCKTKAEAIDEAVKLFDLAVNNICYIGDGKYDIPALKKVGLSICPSDAIDEVKDCCDIVLNRKGGEGCLAECFTLLTKEAFKTI